VSVTVLQSVIGQNKQISIAYSG